MESTSIIYYNTYIESIYSDKEWMVSQCYESTYGILWINLYNKTLPRMNKRKLSTMRMFTGLYYSYK